MLQVSLFSFLTVFKGWWGDGGGGSLQTLKD